MQQAAALHAQKTLLSELSESEVMAKRSQMPKSSSGSKSGASAGKSGSSRWLLLGVIAAVVIISAGLVLYAIQAAQKKPIEASGRVGEGMSWGPVAAKVTIQEFSDFGCSHCRDFAQNQGQQLRAEYEKTGQVRFEYSPFVLDWNRTADPANAAACAADQGKFWDYHDALFARQGSSAQAFSPAALKGYAAELGLDATTFNRCVDKKERYALLDKVGAEGRARGVNATPTFFINGQKIEGAAAYEVFKAQIDGLLNSGQ
jgi:protein-disulfide isomerase